MSSSVPIPPTPRLSLLRCLSCSNTVECKPADLLRFTQTKWLQCCGEVMTLFNAGDRPAARDTRSDTGPAEGETKEQPPLPGP